MRKFLASIVVLTLSACGGGYEEPAPEPGSLEAKLLDNTSWPYEAVGVLDIIEAGGFDESNYAEWAVGFLLTDPNDEFGVMIEISDGLAQRARFDIDSRKKVRVWLERPKDVHDVPMYPVSKLEVQ